MTTTSEVDRFARERQDADRRYNDALTALDRAIVHVAAMPALDRAELEKLTTALIVFLQQITLFVESKDREIVANLSARLDGVDRSLELVTELRTQMSVVQRAIQTLTRASNSGSASIARPVAEPRASGVALPATTSLDFKYVAFEDQFRGSDTAVAERLRAYVPIFAGADDVLDLGCGRGELLTTLRDAGVTAEVWTPAPTWPRSPGSADSTPYRATPWPFFPPNRTIRSAGSSPRRSSSTSSRRT